MPAHHLGPAGTDALATFATVRCVEWMDLGAVCNTLKPCTEPSWRGILTPERATLTGQMLLDENVASYNHAYPDSTPYAAAPYTYQRPVHQSWSTPELLSALHAYRYNACERPEWATTGPPHSSTRCNSASSAVSPATGKGRGASALNLSRPPAGPAPGPNPNRSGDPFPPRADRRSSQPISQTRKD